MGGFCKCCPACIEILVGDLPTITIPGWTAGAWTGGPCCWCIEFTPNSVPAWTESCTPDWGIAKLDIDCTWDERALTLRKPRVANATTCPIPSDWCCDGPVVTIGTGESSVKLWKNYNLLLAYRAKKITICISRQEVDCGGVKTTKYVVTAKYCFEHQAIVGVGKAEHQWRDTTLTDSCFEQNGSASIPGSGVPFCDIGSKTDNVRPAPCSLADVGADDILLSSGDVCFDRVKFFDLMPTGTINWSNSDVSGGCTWGSCDSPVDETTQFCWSISGWPAFKPCWCNYDWYVSSSTTTTDITTNCGCDTCLGGGSGTNYDVVPSPCDTVERRCCAGGYTCNSVCFSYSTVCYSRVWGGPPADCPEPFFGLGEGTNCFFCWSQCGCLAPCHKLKASTGPSDPCYWHVFCDGVEIATAPKYASIPSTGTSSIWSTDCVFLGAVSLCLDAPSWTTVFL